MRNAKRAMKSKKHRRKFLQYALLFVFTAVCIVTSFVRAQSVEYTTIEVIVEEGDTLWGIWERNGYGRADEWIHEVKKMNEQDLSILRPYSKITVPVIK